MVEEDAMKFKLKWFCVVCYYIELVSEVGAYCGSIEELMNYS